MMGLGWQELTIILVIVVIIFGAGKLPEIGSGLGKGIRGFKEESGLGDDEKKSGDAIESGTSQTSTTLTASSRDSRETVADQVEADKRERNIRADEI